jgi:hypothetical protein
MRTLRTVVALSLPRAIRRPDASGIVYAVVDVDYRVIVRRLTVLTSHPETASERLDNRFHKSFI